MKVFIVFFALLIVNLSFMVYQSDMANYEQVQSYLKATAEECAAGASLYYDEASYSEGRLTFQYQEGEAYVKYLLENQKSNPLGKKAQVQYHMVYEDDTIGYSGNEIPSVTVLLKMQTPDLFRLPFLTRTEVVRMAKYELPH